MFPLFFRASPKYYCTVTITHIARVDPITIPALLLVVVVDVLLLVEEAVEVLEIAASVVVVEAKVLSAAVVEIVL